MVPVGGEWVGDVEGEVADGFEASGGEVVDCAWVAGEDAVRVGAFDEFEEALFAGFLDARGG